MKKFHVALVALGVSLTTLTNARAESIYAKTIVAQGPIAYYRLQADNPEWDEVANEVTLNMKEVASTGANGLSSPTFPGFEPDNSGMKFDRFNANSFLAVKSPTIMSSVLGSSSFWFKLAPYQLTPNPQMLLYGANFTSGDGFGGGNELHIHVSGTDKLEYAGRLGVYVQGGTAHSIKEIVTATGNLADDAWHHVALTWDRNDAIRVYVDGDDVFDITHDANAFNFNPLLRFGKTGTGRAIRRFNGEVDELALFAHALGPDAVRQQYLSAVPEPSTLALLAGGTFALTVAWFRGRRARKRDSA